MIAVCALMLASIGAAQADSSNFAGPYVGITGSGYGVQAEGTSNSSAVAGGTSGSTDRQICADG